MERAVVHDVFLSATNVASWLGISPKTVYKWVYAGKLQATKLGRRVVFKEEDIRRFILTNKAFPKAR